MFYVGGTFAYVAGMDWKPTIILFNSEREYWVGPITGNGVTGTQMNFIGSTFGLNDTGMYNACFFQARAGVLSADKLDILASFLTRLPTVKRIRIWDTVILRWFPMSMERKLTSPRLTKLPTICLICWEPLISLPAIISKDEMKLRRYATISCCLTNGH